VRTLQEPVGQGRFAVIDMGNYGKISYILKRAQFHSPAKKTPTENVIRRVQKNVDLTSRYFRQAKIGCLGLIVNV
jgi:hypothetical protein